MFTMITAGYNILPNRQNLNIVVSM